MIGLLRGRVIPPGTVTVDLRDGATWTILGTWASVLVSAIIATIAARYKTSRVQADIDAAARIAALAARAAAVQFRVRRQPARGDDNRWSACTITALNLQEHPVFDVELWVDGARSGAVGDVLLQNAQPFHWHNVALAQSFRRLEDAGHYINETFWPMVEVRYSVQGHRFARKLNKTDQIGID